MSLTVQFGLKHQTPERPIGVVAWDLLGVVGVNRVP